MVLYSRLLLFALGIHFACQAQAMSIREHVEFLLAQDMTLDASRAKVVEQLAALGEEGSAVLAEKLESKDLFLFLALHDALLKLEHRASPALRAQVDLLPEHRSRSAMAILAQLGNPEDLEFFLRYTAHEDWRLRGQALRGIARTNIVSTTVEVHLLPLLNDPDDRVRRAAVNALGHVGTQGASAALLGRLSDESFFVRRAAARAFLHLLKRHPEHAAGLLREVIPLTAPTYALPTRLAAIGLLGHGDDKASANTLKQLALDRDWAIRSAALRALLPHHRHWIMQNVSQDDPDPLVQSLLSQLENQ